MQLVAHRDAGPQGQWEAGMQSQQMEMQPCTQEMEESPSDSPLPAPVGMEVAPNHQNIMYEPASQMPEDLMQNHMDAANNDLYTLLNSDSQQQMLPPNQLQLYERNTDSKEIDKHNTRSEYIDGVDNIVHFQASQALGTSHPKTNNNNMNYYHLIQSECANSTLTMKNI